MKRLFHWFSSLFSPEIEESQRLRTLALAALIMSSLGLAWVGGSWWYSLTGCVLGIAVHWTSWRWRHHQSRIRPLLIAAGVIGASIWMRSETLAAFNGDWVPVGHFLILVMGISSFDLRTRGGLYTSLALGGTVLFFASQQAFGPGFGFFFIGYLVALLGFLELSFMEDAIHGAQVFWRKRELSVSFFWVGSICAMFLLSNFAFWLMPKEAIEFIGPAQVSILPYSTSTLDGASGVPNIDLAALLSDAAPAGKQVPEGKGPKPSEPGLPVTGSSGSQIPSDSPQVAAPNSGKSGAERPSVARGQTSGEDPPARFDLEQGVPGLGATLPNGTAAAPEDVALFVRSKVFSYWRGQTRSRFIGGRWLSGSDSGRLIPVEGLTRRWYNSESANLDNSIRYHQSFFVRLDHLQSVFMGYRGLKVIEGSNPIDGKGVRDGDSYQVVSARPRDDPQRLDQDYTTPISPEYLRLAPGLDGDLRKIAGRLSQGTATDFQRLEKIVGYVAANTRYASDLPLQPGSEVRLIRFLKGEDPGGDLEFATAVTLLARASGLPARLALGYLPGVRDPLSGAHLVRVKDAHAWSEIYFANHGWVPFDSTPKAAAAAAANHQSGFSRFFQSGVNSSVPRAMDNLPIEFPDSLLNALRNPLLSASFIALALSF